MNTILKLTAAAAALAALSGCDMIGGGNKAGNTANAAADNATADNASNGAEAGGKDPVGAENSASAAPFTGEVTREFLVGRWTDNNDCSNVIEFFADGRFVTAGGQGQGIWALDGDRLTFQGERTITARVQAPDADTITLIHADGTLGRSTRCS